MTDSPDLSRPFSPAEDQARFEECRRITRLMEEQAGFSYLRMGDGELNWILRHQGQFAPARERYSYRENAQTDITATYSVTGLEPGQLERLLHAYRRCDYLDLFDRRPFNAENNPKVGILEHRTGPRQTNNPSPQTSMIFYDWIWHEFAAYLGRHRCLVVGAEAGLFRELLRRPDFPPLNGQPWPAGDQVVFSIPPENGRNYSRHLDDYKGVLATLIEREKIHTVFLAYASAAKILGVELAEELGVRTFDLGSTLRGLCNAAMPGYHNFRSFHHPFYHHVPLATFLPAMIAADPCLSRQDVLLRCQAQIMHCLHPSIPAWSTSSDTEPNLSPAALRNLRADLATYRRSACFRQAVACPSAWPRLWRFEKIRLRATRHWTVRAWDGFKRILPPRTTTSAGSPSSP
ncbi:MAG: hypothetical protein ABII82_11100 [Verrucomicrobiota bacterium]